jgi:hypothetical protein
MGKRAPQIQSLVFWHMDPYPITIGNPLSISRGIIYNTLLMIFYVFFGF